jgi:hypothetical protein
MFTGIFSPPEVAAFSALPQLLPFIILKENVHYLAVLISGHHGPVVFIFGDGTDVNSTPALPQGPPQLEIVVFWGKNHIWRLPKPFWALKKLYVSGLRPKTAPSL